MDRPKIKIPSKYEKTFILHDRGGNDDYAELRRMEIFATVNRADLGSSIVTSVQRGKIEDDTSEGIWSDAIVGEICILCREEKYGGIPYFVSATLRAGIYGGGEIYRLSIHHYSFDDRYKDRLERGSEMFNKSMIFETTDEHKIKMVAPDLVAKITSRSSWWRARMWPKVRDEADCDECLVNYSLCHHYQEDLKAIGIEKK